MRVRKKSDRSIDDLYRIAQQQLRGESERIAFQHLSPLLGDQYPYLPKTRGSIDSHSLLILINDIVLHGRKAVIEFGSGLSTMLIGRLIRKNGLDTRLLSVENDAPWAEMLRQNLKKEGIDPFVEIVTAPLEPASFLPEHTLPWYSTAVLDRAIGGRRFDMVIVDGPVAWHKEIELARLPAAGYMKEKLEDDFSLFLHDADRAGEQYALQVWDGWLGIKSRPFTPKLSGYLSNERYNISI